MTAFYILFATVLVYLTVIILFIIMADKPRKKYRADRVMSKAEMKAHLLEVCKKETEDLRRIATELYPKVLNKSDTPTDWIVLKAKNRSVDFYVALLRKYT